MNDYEMNEDSNFILIITLNYFFSRIIAENNGFNFQPAF